VNLLYRNGTPFVTVKGLHVSPKKKYRNRSRVLFNFYFSWTLSVEKDEE
jgi:hypothetical protein